MRVALIAPKWYKMINSYPPLGLAYLAAVVRKYNKCDVKIFDLGLTPKVKIYKEIREILQFKPDVVGITAMTNVYYNACKIAQMLKNSQHSIKIVMGGPHVTIFPMDAIKNEFVDFVVVGEGEKTFVELIDAIENKKSFAHIKGLVYKEGDKIVQNAARELISDLDKIPFPARDLLKLEHYPLRTYDGKPMVTMITSRGCPFNCSYCYKGIFGNIYRKRSAENILEEIKYIVNKHNYRCIYFIDDIFTLDKERLKKLCELILKEKLSIEWQCLSRVDTITKDMLTLMYEAGCRQIHYGIESGNENILKNVGRETPLNMIRDVVKWTKQAKIRVKGYFMIGLPGDTVATALQTIRFAKELELDDVMFSVTTPFPGTALWNKIVQQHKGLKFEKRFVHAYYYIDSMGKFVPFLNVSNMSTDKLIHVTQIARKVAYDIKYNKKYQKRFKKWGTLILKIRKLPIIKTILQYIFG